MKKSLVGLSILLSLTSNCLAFDYVSKEGGFKAKAPDDGVICGTKSTFVTISETAGIHGLRLVEGHPMLTKKVFEADLKKMKTDISEGKNLLSEGKYGYLMPQKELFTKQFKQASADDKGYTYNITKVMGEPALEVKAEVPFSYTMPWSKKMTKEEQEKFRTKHPEVVFTKDGKSLSITGKTVGSSYYFMKNHKLYNLTHGYMEMVRADALLDVSEETKETIEKMRKSLKLPTKTNFDLKEYRALTKHFDKSISFTKPEKDNAPLLVPDAVFTKNHEIPHDWLYMSSTSPGFGGTMQFTTALPLKSIEAMLEDKTMEGFFSSKGSVNMQDMMKAAQNVKVKTLADFYKEGIVSVSLTVPEKVSPFPKLLKEPAVTKLLFNNFMQEPFLMPEDAVRLARYFKMENVSYNMDINPDNALISLVGTMKLHVPETLGKLQEKDYDLDKDNNLLPIQRYLQGKVYFDKASRFNGMVYFKTDRTSAPSPGQEAFDSFKLFSVPTVHTISIKA